MRRSSRVGEAIVACLMLACSSGQDEGKGKPAVAGGGSGGSSGTDAGGGVAGGGTASGGSAGTPGSGATGGATGGTGGALVQDGGTSGSAGTDAGTAGNPGTDAGVCVSKWTPYESCAGGTLVTSTAVQSGALFLSSQGAPAGCSDEFYVRVFQSPVNGDFQISVAFQQFSASGSDTQPATIALYADLEGFIINNAPRAEVQGGATTNYAAVGQKSSLSQTPAPLTATSGTLTISRTGASATSTVQLGSVTQSSTINFPINTARVGIAIRGSSDPGKAAGLTSIAITDVSVTGGGTLFQSDDFACDSVNAAPPTCDGDGFWSGCRGNGCSVCAELVAGYPKYFANHPSCSPNTTCAGRYWPCSTACPEPSPADL